MKTILCDGPECTVSVDESAAAFGWYTLDSPQTVVYSGERVLQRHFHTPHCLENWARNEVGRRESADWGGGGS